MSWEHNDGSAYPLRSNFEFLSCCLVSKSYLTLCDPTDCSPPDCSVHGIFQVRILEWVAIFFSRASSQPTDWMCLLHCRQMGSSSKWRYLWENYTEGKYEEVGNGKYELRKMRGTSFVVQWLRVRLAMQEMQFSPWSGDCAGEQLSLYSTTEPAHCSCWNLCALESVLCHKRSHCNEKPAHHS